MIKNIDDDDLHKLNRFLLKQLIVAIMIASLFLAVLLYILSQEGVDLSFGYIIGIILSGIFLAVGFIAGNVIHDRLKKAKSIDIKTVTKPEKQPFKAFDSAVAARCTQKQNFGAGEKDLLRKNEVFVGNERMVLPPEQFSQLNHKDSVEVHRALKSRFLLKIVLLSQEGQ